MEIMNNGSRERFWKIGELTLLVLSLFLAVQVVSGVKSYWYIGENIQNQPTISFSGKGEVFSVPDIASFTFSVTENAKTVLDAQEKATKKINAALGVLKSKGIKDKDIKTSDYSVYPKYEYSPSVCTQFSCPPSRQILTGYEVSQTVSVKVRKVADAGAILGLLGETAVTNISGLNFTVDDEEALVREARQKAIADAKGKAATLSKDLGVRLVRIISFSENGGGMPIYYGAKTTLGMGGDVETRPTPDIPTGENKITSEVTITYEIR